MSIGSWGRGAFLVGCFLPTVLASTEGTSRSARDETAGEKFAHQAVSLMNRVLETPLPKDLPAELAKEVAPHVVTDYSRGVSVYEGVGFFQPAFLRSSDRKLFRELRRYWAIPPVKKLASLRKLSEYYYAEDDPLQTMLAQLISEIASDGFDVAQWEAIAEPVLLDLLERTSNHGHAEELLETLTRGDFRLSEGGYIRLLHLDQKWATSARGWPRPKLVRALANSSTFRTPPKEVAQYLLQVVAADPCDEVRAWAVKHWIVEVLDEERVVSVYVDALEEAKNRSRPLALGLIKVLGTSGQFTEAIPVLIQTLDSHDLQVVTRAITALERITGLGPEALGYGEEYDEYRLQVGLEPRYQDPSVPDAVRRAASIWKNWWQRENSGSL